MEYAAHKWITKTIYIDIETGEVISKKLANRDYIIIKTERKVQYGNYSNTIEHTRLCERNRQQRLGI